MLLDKILKEQRVNLQSLLSLIVYWKEIKLKNNQTETEHSSEYSLLTYTEICMQLDVQI